MATVDPPYESDSDRMDALLPHHARMSGIVAGVRTAANYERFLEIHRRLFDSGRGRLIAQPANEEERLLVQAVQDFNSETRGGVQQMAARIRELLGNQAAATAYINTLPPNDRDAFRTALDHARQFLGSRTDQSRVERCLEDGREGPVTRLAAQIAHNQQTTTSDGSLESVFRSWSRAVAASTVLRGVADPDDIINEHHHLQPRALGIIQRHARQTGEYVDSEWRAPASTLAGPRGP